MTTQTFQYRTGPTGTRERRSHLEVAEHLRNHPGVWAVVRTAPNNTAAASAAYQIRQGRRAAFRPAGSFDAYSDGTEVVARYIVGCHPTPLPPGGYCTICGTVNPDAA